MLGVSLSLVQSEILFLLRYRPSTKGIPIPMCSTPILSCSSDMGKLQKANIHEAKLPPWFYSKTALLFHVVNLSFCRRIFCLLNFGHFVESLVLFFIEVFVQLFTSKCIFPLKFLEEGVTWGKQYKNDIKVLCPTFVETKCNVSHITLFLRY